MSSTAPVTFWAFGLVPVQGWIAEARRSRDLRAGSRFLTWAMARLLALVEEQNGEPLLPPGSSAAGPAADRFEQALGGGARGLSNRASGRLAAPRAAGTALMRRLEDELERTWAAFVAEAATAARRATPAAWKELAPAVTEPPAGPPPCPVGLVWAVVELAPRAEETDGDFVRRGLAAVDRLYAGAKWARPLVVEDGAPVPKCSQCGRREAAGGPAPQEWRRLHARLAAVAEVRRELRLGLREHLCRVCTLKRYAGYLDAARFPSTSAIAARDWLRRLTSSDDLRQALGALEGAIGRVPGYDEPWADPAPLYFRSTAERLVAAADREGDGELGAAVAEVRKRQQALARRIGRLPPEAGLAAAPPDYLAVLAFDGDDFGRRLRQHLDVLPQRVAAFPPRVEALLAEAGEPPWGEAFYLGGDEGLILAPAGSVLPLARAIRRLWEEEVAGGGVEATVSMGVAIFHRERPLGPAVDTAHAAVARAKQVPGKNALAVTVQTASGSRWTACARWDEGWDRVEAAVGMIRDGRLAAGWPHDVERFLRSLPEEAFAAGDAARDAVREEVRRLTRRRSGAAGRRGGAAEARAAEVWERLRGEAWWRRRPGEEELDTEADRLHLTAFLARVAGPAPAPERGG